LAQESFFNVSRILKQSALVLPSGLSAQDLLQSLPPRAVALFVLGQLDRLASEQSYEENVSLSDLIE